MARSQWFITRICRAGKIMNAVTDSARTCGIQYEFGQSLLLQSSNSQPYIISICHKYCEYKCSYKI